MAAVGPGFSMTAAVWNLAIWTSILKIEMFLLGNNYANESLRRLTSLDKRIDAYALRGSPLRLGKPAFELRAGYISVERYLICLRHL